MNTDNWTVVFPNEGNCADVIKFEDKIGIVTKSESYCVVKLQSDLIQVSESSVYRLCMSLKNQGVSHKVIYTWINEGGELLLRGYAHDEDQLISPKGASGVIIELIVFSFSKGEFEIYDMELKYLHEYCASMVKMAAVHIDTWRDFATTCEKNMLSALEGIDRVSKENPDIIVLTERFYDRRADNCAISINDEPIRLLQGRALKYNTYIAFSFREKNEGEYHNTGVLINREGEIAGIYRKTHLTMTEIESGMVPGNELPVFETDFGKVAIAICWDMWFAELVREYFKKGVRLLINPTAGFPDIQTRARAMDNGMYIISAGVMDRSNTRIINPLGEVVADASDNGYAIAEVNLTEPKLQYWLSVGDTYGEGKNVYRFESRGDLYTG